MISKRVGQPRMARLPAPRPSSQGVLLSERSEPDSEAAPPGEEAPPTPWSSAKVLPTSHARKIRRGNVTTGLLGSGNVDEQTQLADWAEHLHEEILALTKERDSLAASLASAQAESVQTRMGLEQAERRCAELERLGGGSTDVGENADLRKQLRAYAIEVEKLRRDMEGLHASNSVSTQVLQKMHAEREELQEKHLRLQDEHRQNLDECKRLSDLHGSERQHRQRLESQFQGQSSEKEAEATMRQEILQREHQKNWEELQKAHSAHQEKDGAFRALAQLAQDAMAMVAELQESFVEQTRKYQELAKSVRNQQQELSRDCQEAEELAQHTEKFAGELKQLLGHTREANSAGEDQWKQEAHRLDEELRKLTTHHREAAKTVRELRQADDKRKAKESQQADQELQRSTEKAKKKMERDGLMTNPNIIRQMAQAMTGIEVEKIDQKSRAEKRLLKVICDVKPRGQGGDLQLRWSKAPYRDFSDRSSCDLTKVMSIGYGFAARAPWLFRDAPPHLCFSLHTPSRSFDFICNSDSDVEALVLVISRLCTRSQGWPLHGGVNSHSRFMAMKGWTKVQAACRANKSTFSTHLLEAASKLQLGPSQRGPSLPPPPAETDILHTDTLMQDVESASS
ncbi:unnamed protein product [Effrenium voratum]|uniref:Uncharacterized protein n=1 Tax=Effrenium voratum TaxID=2562239 RepID=A0AA36HXM1_9DINO|nr:unnamed protein product [Effrenium voratum]CAJ1376477.1 unnamed protein product [Effrenium voratum]